MANIYDEVHYNTFIYDIFNIYDVLR